MKNLKFLVLLSALFGLSANAQLIYGPRGGTGGGGGGGTGPLTPTIYVATNGVDGTAVRGNPAKPYATVNSAFAAAQNNDVIYLYPGTYVVTPDLMTPAEIVTADVASQTCPYLLNVTNVTVKGYGATIYGAGQGNLVNIKGTQRLTFEGVTFQGNWPTTNFVAGTTNLTTLFAHVYGCWTNTDLKIRDCQFLDFGNHGVASPLVHDNKWRKGLTVLNSNFIRGGATNVYSPESADGVAIGVDGGESLIDGNYFDDVTRAVELFGYQRTGATQAEKLMSNVRVVNNLFKNVKSWAILSIGSSLTEGITNHVGLNILNNNFENCGIFFPNNIGADSNALFRGCIWVSEGSFINISHNFFSGGERSAINLLAGSTGDVIDNFLIQGNTIQNFKAHGVDVERQVSGAYIRQGVIGDNIIKDCWQHGIYVAGGNDLIIRNNNLTGNGHDSGAVGGLGQLRIHAFSGVNTTNIQVLNNYVGPSPATNGNSVAITSSVRTDNTRIIDNQLGVSYKGVNTAVQLLNTGELIQEFYRTTTDATVTAWLTNAWQANRSLYYETEQRGFAASLGVSTILSYYGMYTNGASAAGRVGTESTKIILEENSATAAGNNASATGFQFTLTGIAATTMEWIARIRVLITP